MRNNAAQRVEGRREGREEPLGARCEHHRVAAPEQERVRQLATQDRERLADGRLRDAELTRRGRGALRAQQRF